MTNKMLDKILENYNNGMALSHSEIEYLLSVRVPEDMEKIFKVARTVRQQTFGNSVFLYGFVYFSTYCKNNCTFCFFRKDNKNPPRYRKTLEEVVETAVNLKKSGVHLIDLTTGDDPYFTEHPERMADIVKAVKAATGLCVMVSPGVLDQHGIELIKEADADWYALYQETHNRELYKGLRPEQPFDRRMSAKMAAANAGLLIEEGLLTGIGDTVKDAAHSFDVMKTLGVSQVRSMSYILQEGAPHDGAEKGDCHNEVMMIAVMRMLFPDVLIPASLDVEGLQGLEKRLNAGSNVVTSIIPPSKGYLGVANAVHDIDEGYRTVQGIQETLSKCHVEQATAEAYKNWVDYRKKMYRTTVKSAVKCG